MLKAYAVQHGLSYVGNAPTSCYYDALADVYCQAAAAPNATPDTPAE